MHNYHAFGECFKSLRKNMDWKSEAWQACLDKPEFSQMKKPIIGDNPNLPEINESAILKIEGLICQKR